jgi:hypothetical protein
MIGKIVGVNMENKERMKESIKSLLKGIGIGILLYKIGEWLLN